MAGDRLEPYLCELHRDWLAREPGTRCRELDGSLLFFDISGFTPLTERLAKRGKAGVEQLIETLNGVVAPLVDTAARLGGDTLKFGGDALLLLFSGDEHERRACAAAFDMQATMRPYRRMRTNAGIVSLRASAAVASGPIDLFLAGDRFRELLVAGPTTSEVMGLEKDAKAGEVLLGVSTSARLQPGCRGADRADGTTPLAARPEVEHVVKPTPAPHDPRQGLPAALHDHLGPAAESEHRQVTIAFAQFRGLDELLQRDGPRAAADEVHALLTCAQKACDDHGVTFLATDADRAAGKIFAVTGAPTASTDDEDRMLLAMREIVAHEGSLRVRAGVNRGRTFVVHLGAPQRRTYTAMGDTTNLAARVMGKAPDGQVLATRAVVEHARAPFAFAPVAPFSVKGKSVLIEAEIVGEPRSVAPRAAVDSPLAGRTAELRVLRDALRAARAGDGRIVELRGEPGIGKSRLVAEVAGEAARDGMSRLAIEAGAYGTSTPYLALRAPLRRLVEAEGDDAEIAAALTRVVRAHLPRAEPMLPLIAIAFGLDLPPTPETARLSADASAAQLHLLVDRLLAALLPERRTLILVEDAHWLDEASSELLRTVLRRAGKRGWTALVTRRAVDSGLTDLPGNPVYIELQPLGPEAARSLVLGGGRRALAPHVTAALVERANGNPFFLRELASAARSGAQLDELPDTVEALLTARIDTLAPAQRRLLRRAAVLGQRFPLSWLAGMLEQPEDELRAGLAPLSHFLELEEGSGRVRFGHALQREAAYETLPYGRRRSLHARAGELIERTLGPAAQSAADILALHFLRAHEFERAWRYGRIAADLARERFAPTDAAQLYRRAIEAARALPSLPRAELTDVWQALGEACSRTGEPDAAMEAFTQARRLAGDDPLRQAQLMLCHARVAMDARNVGRAARWLRRALNELEREEAPAAAGCKAELMAELGSVRHRQGRSPEAITLCEEAAQIAERHDARSALAQALYTLHIALVESGRSADAVHASRALEIYRELGDLDREGAVLTNLGVAAYFEGRWEDAAALYLQAGEASARAGDVANAAIGECNIGEVRSDQGRVEEAEFRLRRAREILAGSGYEWGVGFIDTILGRTAIREGRRAAGFELLVEALAQFRRLRTGQDVIWVEALIAEANAYRQRPELAIEEVDRLVRDLAGGGRFAPLLQRVRGYALAQLGERDAAAAAFEASILDARTQDAPFELALTLDALLEFGAQDGSVQAERRRERDEIVARLAIVRLPQPPLGLGRTPTAPDAAAGVVAE
ncbi:MAG TPA: AAA family ATPase [Solirubrobacteraceae bacterium]|nr:AAA family ATPase [Solirubrobacteraceae bacterium]